MLITFLIIYYSIVGPTKRRKKKDKAKDKKGYPYKKLNRRETELTQPIK